MDRAEHTATVRLEHVLALGVPDAVDHLARDLLHVEVGLALDLPRKHNLAGGHQCFTGHLAAGVEGEEMVDEGITDLVGDLVRMAFADRLGGEEVWHGSFFAAAKEGVLPGGITGFANDFPTVDHTGKAGPTPLKDRVQAGPVLPTGRSLPNKRHSQGQQGS